MSGNVLDLLKPRFAALLVTGCSVLQEDKIDYQSAKKGTTLDVPVATTDTGGYLNAITAATPCDPVVAVPHLANCALLTDLNGGSDAESDLALLTRASTVFSRVTSALVTASAFSAYALEQPFVKRAVAVDQYDHDGGNSPGDDDGFLTVYV